MEQRLGRQFQIGLTQGFISENDAVPRKDAVFRRICLFLFDIGPDFVILLRRNMIHHFVVIRFFGIVGDKSLIFSADQQRKFFLKAQIFVFGQGCCRMKTVNGFFAVLIGQADKSMSRNRADVGFAFHNRIF